MEAYICFVVASVQSRQPAERGAQNVWPAFDSAVNFFIPPKVRAHAVVSKPDIVSVTQVVPDNRSKTPFVTASARHMSPKTAAGSRVW
jgi:hypothetical protein